MKNPNINKHLIFKERCKIEKYINKVLRKYQIANELSQKSHLENNHNFVRKILSNSQS